MLNFLRIAGLLLLALPGIGYPAGLSSQALEPQQDVAVPTLTQRVTDLTGTLDAQQQQALEARLATLEQQQGSQVAILIVPTTLPEAIEQYSIRVVDQWKLGREDVDDGILILVAKNDRKVRVEVGYGLEGTVPDAVANRIIDQTIVPYFRQGDFHGGLAAAVEQLSGLIAGEPLPEPQMQKSGSGQWEGMLPLLLFGGLIAGGILRAILGNFLGGAATGGLIGAVVWLLGGGLLIALVLAVVAFVITLSGGLGFMSGGRGMIGGGGFGGGGFGSGGFSGGGGGFGGGGASGSW